MTVKLVLCLVLIFHTSVTPGFAEVFAPTHHSDQSATMHDLHSHTHAHHHETAHHPSHAVAVQAAEAGELHEHSHTHGTSVQMNADIPDIPVMDFFTLNAVVITPYQFHHRSQSYTPSVPPPELS